ncbi:N-6 DNA methylase, partial [Aeromonas salmonicida]|uniref:N-6 DNA methylase n=1 Tax=Aeromonas salmonicida TaxID=645 RepID=UPI003D025D83
LMLSYIPPIFWHRKIKVLDLCMGEGALLKSVQKISNQVEFYGTDIDPYNISHAKENGFNLATMACVDATSHAVLDALKDNNFDLVLGNPPFKLIENIGLAKEITTEFNLDKSSRLIEAELFFLLLGIKLLKINGYLAYILPDGFLTKKSLSQTRSILSKNFSIQNVIEIPPKAFNGTEAKTHILILKKAKNIKDKIKLSQTTYDDIYISNENFTQRGDYSYYFNTKEINDKSIKSIGATILRGKKTKRELEINGFEHYIHTSHLKAQGKKFFNTSKVNDDVKAIAGDIIVARVGTRVIGNFGIVINGEFRISDCVFIIRCTDEKSRDQTISTLASDFGKKWLSAISKGVGAKHITLQDLYSLPIYQEDSHEHSHS